MKKFSVGFIVGLMLGGVVPAAAAVLVGSSGYLSGWTVTKNGDEICYMPYVWAGVKEIECD